MSDFGFFSPSTRFFHSCSSSLSISAFVAFGRFPLTFSRGALAFPSRVCLNLRNPHSLTMEILLSFCQFEVSPKAANITTGRTVRLIVPAIAFPN